MKITVIGTGYVGLVSGACLADVGNDVLCFDVDAAKVAALTRGEVHIFEPGLEDVVRRNLKAGRLKFTGGAKAATTFGTMQFIAVGTPPGEVGSDDERAIGLMRELYAPFQRNHERFVLMDVQSAELTKYAANAMLATRISFMNEMANLAEKLGADIELVRKGIGSDPRIGYDF